MSPQGKGGGRGKKPKPKSRAQRVLLSVGWLLPLAALLIGGAILLLTYAFASIPLPREIKLDQTARVYDVNGKLIGTFSGEERRIIISPKRMPEHVKQAVIAAEDRDFYDHNGVSIKGILRAGWANITGGEIAQGGSTITQQYIKNAVLRDPSRTVTRKVKEAVLAIKLERRYSKAEILGFYLNTIYLGRGAYGIQAAAQSYFGKPASALTLPEAAYLASIVPSPESYQPDEHPKLARERRNDVLDVMVVEGYITEQEAEEAKIGKVKTIPRSEVNPREQIAAYFMEWLRREHLEPEFGNRLYTDGLKIYTTLDLEMQQQAEQAVAGVLTEPTDPQASLVSVTPRGEVRAFVGGTDFMNQRKARGTIFASDPPGHQSGSALKPFTLLAAIEDGISPQSRFSGASPATIEDPRCAQNGQPWQPENFGGSSYGTLTLDQATTNSVNTIYAQLAAEVGPEAIASTLEDFGFSPKLGANEITPVCSLALGAFPATPVEMARAYAGFAGRGRLPDVIPVRYVLDGNGDCRISYLPQKFECEEEKKTAPRHIAEQNDADVLTQTLTHVVTSGTAAGSVEIGRPAAGKTGTAQNNVSSWFAGYVPQLTTVVWMGYPIEKGPDGQRGTGDDFVPRMGFCSDVTLCRPVHGIEVTGGSFPAQIWDAYMELATAGMEVVPFAIPSDLPDEVINSAPPVTPTPTPTEDESPSPQPTEEPVPTPKPTEVPTEIPSPTPPTPASPPSPTPPGDGAPGDGPAGGPNGPPGGGPGDRLRAKGVP
jgi:membrane peptidoglycan carboxypeptidase